MSCRCLVPTPVWCQSASSQVLLVPHSTYSEHHMQLTTQCPAPPENAVQNKGRDLGGRPSSANMGVMPTLGPPLPQMTPTVGVVTLTLVLGVNLRAVISVLQHPQKCSARPAQNQGRSLGGRPSSADALCPSRLRGAKRVDLPHELSGPAN